MEGSLRINWLCSFQKVRAFSYSSHWFIPPWLHIFLFLNLVPIADIVFFPLKIVVSVFLLLFFGLVVENPAFSEFFQKPVFAVQILCILVFAFLR